MARLPNQGETPWGEILNEFLLESHELDGKPKFPSGTLLLETSADLTLTSGQSSVQWTFDAPYMEFADDDVTLAGNMKDILVNEDGWYRVWYSLAIRASVVGYKGQVGTQVIMTDEQPAHAPEDFLQNSSLGELQEHLYGAISLTDKVSVFTSPELHWRAGWKLWAGAYSVDTAGSTGNAIVTSNTYLAITRVG